MSIHRLAILSAAADKQSRRWPRVDELCCPVCRRGVRAERPGYWRMADGAVPEWSHRDGRALCRVVTDDGERPADPVRRDLTRQPRPRASEPKRSAPQQPLQ